MFGEADKGGGGSWYFGFWEAAHNGLADGLEHGRRLEDSSTAIFRLGFVPSGAYIPLIAASRFFTPVVITASRRSGSAYPSWLWNTSYSLPFWRLGLRQWDGRGGLCFVSMGVCLLYVFTLGVVSASLFSSPLSSLPGSLRVAVWTSLVCAGHRSSGARCQT
ncbi:hypothetical protein BT67DRAFT_136979 [Trichocladium antarcticum]|uniref:Uncharacterized protein n=1 Tax=Trichocladium antarcticum TaxID=1450529 RepID=A0AAN6ZBM2_9PEZI|nr:hypothetical protein BT67DRAFT_136979 [Trichocladium antarcticum]